MLKTQLETLLFLSSNPVTFIKLKEFFKVDNDDLLLALKELQADYAAGHGVLLLVQEHQDILKNEYQFVSVPDNLELAQRFFHLQEGVDLSKTALETLTIVAYRGPVKRTEIEYVRGVNSRQILNQLLSRDLVVEVEEDIFEVSGRFLQLLGLTKLSDLDNYEQLHELSLMEKPEGPEIPEEPEGPEQPETPEGPEQPETPEEPEEPESLV